MKHHQPSWTIIDHNNNHINPYYHNGMTMVNHVINHYILSIDNPQVLQAEHTAIGLSWPHWPHHTTALDAMGSCPTFTSHSCWLVSPTWTSNESWTATELLIVRMRSIRYSKLVTNRVGHDRLKFFRLWTMPYQSLFRKVGNLLRFVVVSWAVEALWSLSVDIQLNHPWLVSLSHLYNGCQWVVIAHVRVVRSGEYPCGMITPHREFGNNDPP